MVRELKKKPSISSGATSISYYTYFTYNLPSWNFSLMTEDNKRYYSIFYLVSF